MGNHNCCIQNEVLFKAIYCYVSSHFKNKWLHLKMVQHLDMVTPNGMTSNL